MKRSSEDYANMAVAIADSGLASQMGVAQVYATLALNATLERIADRLEAETQADVPMRGDHGPRD